MPAPSVKLSAWAPMRIALFRAIWIATVISNIGTWAQEIGGPWLMRLLTADRAMVALVTSAGSLSICLLSLLAGALADMVDRRRLLIFMQLWMMAAAAAMGVLCYANCVSPAILLLLTFILGVGAALSGPAYQAIVPELVPPADMPRAVALNAVSLNLARAVGPALGMLAVRLLGPGAAFLLNAVSFLGVAWVLYRWHREPHAHPAPRERLWPAMRLGVRHVLYSPPLRAVLVRVAAFIFCASALWGLIVPVARDQLNLGALGTGSLMVFFGVGAVAGVFLMPRLQQKLSTDPMVALASLLFALALGALALAPNLLAAGVVMFFLGVCWVIVPTNFNIATQKSAPAWVKGRALAMYMTVLFGSIGLGSAFWGYVAQRVSIPASLLAAAAATAAGLLLARRYPLTSTGSADLRLAKHWPRLRIRLERLLRRITHAALEQLAQWRLRQQRLNDRARSVFSGTGVSPVAPKPHNRCTARD